MRALAPYGGGDAAVIADQHVRGIDGAMPLEAILGVAAGNDWGRRLFKKRIGVLIVRRPEAVLGRTRPAPQDDDTWQPDFDWIASAGLAGIACVEGSIAPDLRPAVAREVDARGLFLLARESET